MLLEDLLSPLEWKPATEKDGKSKLIAFSEFIPPAKLHPFPPSHFIGKHTTGPALLWLSHSVFGQSHLQLQLQSGPLCSPSCYFLGSGFGVGKIHGTGPGHIGGFNGSATGFVGWFGWSCAEEGCKYWEISIRRMLRYIESIVHECAIIIIC